MRVIVLIVLIVLAALGGTSQADREGGARHAE